MFATLIPNAGPRVLKKGSVEGVIYLKFSHMYDFEQHLYFYYSNGLNPSPRIEMKIKTSSDDPLQVNNSLNNYSSEIMQGDTRILSADYRDMIHGSQ